MLACFRIRNFSVVLTATAVACFALTATAADENITALTKRLQVEKPKFVQRQQAMLAARYDLADRPSKSPTMSRWKPVQDGVRVKLPKGMNWEKLAALSPEDIREKQLWPCRLSAVAAPPSRSGRHDFLQIYDRGNKAADPLRPRLRLAGKFPAGVSGGNLSDDQAGSGRRLAREAGDPGQLQRVVQGHPKSKTDRGIALAGHAISPATVQRHR